MATTSMIHLDQWANTQAQLTDAEKTSVNLLSDWLASDQGSTSKSEGMGASSAAALPSRPTTAASSVPASGPSFPSAPLSDAPLYLSWYANQEAYMTSASQNIHVRALQRLCSAAEEAEDLLKDLDAARIHISELRSGARYVEEGSEGLREEAETMVERIDHLSQLSQALSLRLSYFAILPTSTSFLSSPSLSLVTSNDFLFTLDRLDIALAFVDAHPHYRDSPLYKMRFEHCVLRAGTLIRMYTLARWKELSNEVATKLRVWEKAKSSKGKEKEFDGDSHVMMYFADPPVYALLWERYEEEAPSLRPLLAELEKRSSIHAAPASTDIGVSATEENPSDEKALLADYSREGKEEGPSEEAKETNGKGEPTSETQIFRSPEFVSLLSECRIAYFEARRALLSGMIASCLAQIEAATQHQQLADASSTTKSPFAAFIRRSLAFLSAVCEKEVTLYGRFFAVEQTSDSSSTKDLSNYIQSLCTTLDDRVRPRLTKETEIAALASICIALVGDRELESDTSPLIYSTLSTVILQEAQERLMARAKLVLTGNTLGQFLPTEDDLDYPSKLKKSQTHRRGQSSIGGAGLLEAAAFETNGPSKKGFRQVDASSPGIPTQNIRLFTSPPKSVVSSWYQPLASTLSLLSTINDAIPTEQFVKIAYDVLDACRSSIAKGAEQMGSQGGLGAGRIGLSGRMDVPLFLLRHLYLLREISASIELRKASAGSLQVDRRVAGSAASSATSSEGILDFAKLVETLNALWAGLRGYQQVAAKGEEEVVVEPPPSTAIAQRKSLSGKRAEALESAINNASSNFIDVVFQGVVLPLRVYMDQRSRRPSNRSRQSVSDISTVGPLSPNPDVKSPPLPLASPSSARSLTTVNKIRSAVKAFETCSETNLKEANEAMRLYLEDDRAIDSLAEPIISRIMDTYATFVHSLETSEIDVSQISELKEAATVQQHLATLIKAESRHLYDEN